MIVRSARFVPKLDVGNCAKSRFSPLLFTTVVPLDFHIIPAGVGDDDVAPLFATAYVMVLPDAVSILNVPSNGAPRPATQMMFRLRLLDGLTSVVNTVKP